MMAFLFNRIFRKKLAFYVKKQDYSWSEGRSTVPRKKLFPFKGYKSDYVDCDYAKRNKVGKNRFHPVFDF